MSAQSRFRVSSTEGLTFFTVGYFYDQHLLGEPAHLHEGGHFHRSERGESGIHHSNGDTLLNISVSHVIVRRPACRDSVCARRELEDTF